MSENIVIATIKTWNKRNAEKLQEYIKEKYSVNIIENKNDLQIANLKSIKPKWIFFPHWSWIIPDSILSNYNCVIFHTSPLPYGRGGSPIQNQIVEEKYMSQICAIKATNELDAGPVYLRRNIDLSKGSADEILFEVSEKIFNMIKHIVNEEPIPEKQVGETYVYKRRKPYMSRLPEKIETERKVYDFIRMLDGEGYPPAFMEYGNMNIELRNARINPDGSVSGDFNIFIREEKNE